MEEQRVEPQSLRDAGIDPIHFPIVDMQVPELGPAMAMCRKVTRLTASGECVAYHCKAGLGRTGTMLAAQLIAEGVDATDALETVRRIEPRYVQSEVQERFLTQFEQHLREQEPDA